MANLFESFVGTADAVVTTPFTVVNWPEAGNNLARLTGSGGLKAVARTDQVGVHVFDTGSANHFVEVEIGSDVSSAIEFFQLVVLRQAASGNGYSVSYDAGADQLYLRQAGFPVGNFSCVLAAGDIIRAEANGGVYKVFLNTVERITYTNAGDGYGAFTRVGFRAQAEGTTTGEVLRSWSGGELAPADATVPTLTGVITEVSKTENSISISWPTGADNVAVTSYEVSTNGGGAWTDTGNTTTSRTFTGLAASTAYDIRVRAKDAAGNVSTPALATTITTLSPDTTVPVLTGAITVGAKSSGTIALSWPTGTDNVGVAAYDVRVNGGSWTSQGTSTSTIVTGLTQLTSYTLEVTARDAAGNRSTPPLSVTTSTYRNGATGQFILDNTGPIGGNPAGILYNDVGVGDEDNWFSFVITTPPATGTLDINPDGTFTFTGPSAATMYYQLEVDGANVGSPQLVDLYETSGGGGDVTAPILSSPTGTATGPTTASGTVVTDEANGTLYFLASTNAMLIDTDDAGFWSAGGKGSQVVVATGIQSVNYSGLTPITSYTVYYGHEDSSGNRSAVVKLESAFTTASVPVFNGAQDALNSIMVGKLRSLGFTGSLNDMLFAFYGGTGTLQDRERVWLIARTAVTGVSNKTMWAVYLRGLGYTGAFPDMLKAFWINY